MNSKGYEVLGWLVFKLGSMVVKRKIEDNRVKVGAAGVVALVLVAGLAAAKAGSGDDS
jgi:hypothetical protein